MERLLAPGLLVLLLPALTRGEGRRGPRAGRPGTRQEVCRERGRARRLPRSRLGTAGHGGDRSAAPSGGGGGGGGHGPRGNRDSVPRGAWGPGSAPARGPQLGAAAGTGAGTVGGAGLGTAGGSGLGAPEVGGRGNGARGHREPRLGTGGCRGELRSLPSGGAELGTAGRPEQGAAGSRGGAGARGGLGPAEGRAGRPRSRLLFRESF